MQLPNTSYLLALVSILTVSLLLRCSGEEENSQDSVQLDSIDSTELNSSSISLSKDTLDPVGINIPRGTQVLPESYKSAVVQEFMNLDLDTVIFSECNNDLRTSEISYKEEHHKLNRIAFTDTSLVIGFTFIENCGSDFLCEVEHVDDSTINLVYHQYSQEGLCACCFGIEYWFKIYPGSIFVPVPPIKRVQFNGENLTELGI